MMNSNHRLPCHSAADTLAGRLAKSARSSGDIRVNGHKSKLSFGRSAYVTQDDVRGSGCLGLLEQTGPPCGAISWRLACLPSVAGLLQCSAAASLGPNPPSLPPTAPQVLIGTLTVYETIMYSAKLRLPQVGGWCTGVMWCGCRAGAGSGHVGSDATRI